MKDEIIVFIGLVVFFWLFLWTIEVVGELTLSRAEAQQIELLLGKA